MGRKLRVFVQIDNAPDSPELPWFQSAEAVLTEEEFKNLTLDSLLRRYIQPQTAAVYTKVREQILKLPS